MKSGGMDIFPSIPCSPDNPKLFGNDDAEIICDDIAEVGPVSWDLFAQEPEGGIGEQGAGRVAFVVGDVLVHDAPQALDRV